MRTRGNSKLLWMIENVSVSACRRQEYLSDWYGFFLTLEYFNAETDVGDLLITGDEEAKIDYVYHEVLEALQKAEASAADLYDMIQHIIGKER